MNKEKFLIKNCVVWYSLLVLAITWVISIAVFSNPDVKLDSLSPITIIVMMAMFLPAILGWIFKRIQYKNKKTQHLFSFKKINKKSILFGIFYPISFLFACTIVVLVLRIGKIDYNKIPNISEAFSILISIIINLVIVFGEEYGWRGYLLPELTKTHGKIKATAIVGIIWSLYHVPLMYLSAKAAGMSNPLIVCLVQAAVVFVFSFSFSYCYYLSENLIPVLLYHAIWNELNTLILGNLTTEEQGILTGNRLYINGEGLLGLIIGTIMVFWFIRQFRKEKHMQKYKQNFPAY